MGNEFQLLGLKSSELLAGLALLVRRGNELTAELLGYLAEVEDRMLFAELGFPSLHAFCVQELRMSEGAAGRRVSAARVCRRFPEVFDLVARGELHLSAVCAVAPHLESGTASELLAACVGKTRRQAEELLAARFPKPDVREQVRRLPGRELEPTSEARFGVHFTADAESKELIERARDLARHRLPGGDLAALFKLALTVFVQGEEKRRFGVGAKARRAAKDTPPGRVIAPEPTSPGGAIAPEPTSPDAMAAKSTPPGGVAGASVNPRIMAAESERSRHVGMAARREVFARDWGQCTFVASGGRRCEARGWLEFDHVRPWAWRGASQVGNLRLRCRMHNLWHARACFGAMHLAAKRAAQRAAL